MQKLGRRRSPQMILPFKVPWKMLKWILSWKPKFNKFLQFYLLSTSNAPHFSTKNKLVIILKITGFWRNNLAIFHDVKKRFFFLITHLFLIFADMEILFIIHGFFKAALLWSTLGWNSQKFKQMLGNTVRLNFC